MAAATFMVISSQFVYWQHYAKGDLVEVDTSRIAASVVSGIGFLAGGAILRTGLTVQGLTTAAGLWLVTAIGMCAGAGMYVESCAVTVLGLLVLTVFRRLEDKNIQRWRISIALSSDADDVKPVLDAIRSLGAAATTLEYDRHFEDGEKTIVIDARLTEGLPLQALIEAIESRAHVRRIHVQHLT
jgi:putative Mg2+ transporter-C (MgtC) family protein